MLIRRLDGNWDMTFGRGIVNYAKDEEATAQSVKSRLLLLLGEWFLDIEAGVPWLQQIMVKPADIPLTESIIKQRILETVGVAELVNFDMIFDNNTRIISIAATVKNIYGTITNIKVDKTT